MSYRVEKDVMVAMRDGEALATDLFIPKSGPAPTLVVRTPYGKDVPNLLGNALNTQALLEAGYAVVFQDCRGRYRSDGSFTPMTNEADDGADTVQWLTEQTWSNGVIGTFGASYLGFTQWALASQAPAGLRAIAPTVTTTDYYASPWYSPGGAFSLHMSLWWSTLMALLDEQRALDRGSGEFDTLIQLAGMLGDLDTQLTRFPVADKPLLAASAPWWADWVGHADRDAFWQQVSVADRASQITVPALNTGGWFDIFADDTLRTFTHMHARAGSAEAGDGQRLIIGPWDHLSYTGAYHDRQFGPAADILGVDLTGAHIAFYDRHLRGRTDALDATAPVRIFVMGIDEWRDEQNWPLPDTRYVDYHLAGTGRANTSDGDGMLSRQAPTGEATDTFTYDPHDPVPTRGGRVVMPASLNAVGPVDQREVESRDDVLCFTTEVLVAPVEVTGHISLVLHATSSAVDTDFTGKIVDVFPDGRAIYLTDGILRARYRNSLEHPEPLDPALTHELTVDLGATSNVFLAGHRIRLEISSSNFPRYDRNTNTGGTIATETSDDVEVAINSILHGPAHPSRLILPIIER